MKGIKLAYRTKSFLLAACSMIFLCGCDPEFKYEFSGKIVSELNKPINVHYKFLPLESANNWRSMITDSIVRTNENGKFQINISTLTVNFDSLRISINELGYEPLVKSTPKEEWKTSIGFGLKEFKHEFEDLQLIKIDSTKACELGKENASQELRQNKYTYYEFLSQGQIDDNYKAKLIEKMQNLGINYKAIALSKYEPNSKEEIQRNCYLEKMKQGIKRKFGDDWLEKLKRMNK